MSTPTQPTPVSGAQSTSSPGIQPSTTTEYTVRVPNDRNKKFSMMKFSTGTNLDFLKLTNTSVRMERENNLRDYKSVYNIDAMPKYGAGSEYGREQKEEARRKKYGITVKAYNPEDQPWQMKVGKGKDAKRYKGVREGTITENTSYYIFMQCADGAFEAFPIEEWYNFQPVVQYKYLNSEEAEEEFSKRDKTMNFFSIMVRKRIKNDPDAQEEEGAQKEEKKTKDKKDKSLILTDMDDWAASSDEEEENMDGDEDKESKPKKDKKKGNKGKKRRKNAKINDNDEAVEESDEGDFDDRELDYISDSGSESDLDEKGKEEKYDDKGVDQERGLKKLIDSEDEESEEEEEEEKKEEEEKEEEEVTDKKSKKKNKENKGDDDSDSSSSSSDSDDSDIDKNEDKFSSVLFMQKKKGGSRPNTPTVDKTDSKIEQKTEGIKRKMESDDIQDPQKKMRTDSPAPGASATSSGEITEEAIRRYLLRRPMTAKEIVQKFRGKLPQLSKDQMTQKIGQLLKKINPEKKVVNGTLLLFLSEKKKD